MNHNGTKTVGPIRYFCAKTILQVDRWVPFKFISCLHYTLRSSIDLMKENALTVKKARSKWYPAEIINDSSSTDNSAFLANASAKPESLLHDLGQTAKSIALHVNSDKTEFMCFKQVGVMSLKCNPQKSVDQFIYLGSNISSTESNINIRVRKTWTAIDKLSTMWKSDRSDKIKFCTTWPLTKLLEKMDGTNYRLFWTSPRSSTLQLYGNLNLISQTIQIKRTRQDGDCWQSKENA